MVKNNSIDYIIQNFLGEPSETVIQLHGEENVDYCRKLKQKIPNIDVWKAFRIKSQKDLQMITSYENFIDAILLDSWNKETSGGSGIRIKSINLRNINFSKPWWLAGGVSIEWLDEIFEKIKPNGLDISSSVEISPGKKDIFKVRSIIEKIRRY